MWYAAFNFCFQIQLAPLHLGCPGLTRASARYRLSKAVAEEEEAEAEAMAGEQEEAAES